MSVRSCSVGCTYAGMDVSSLPHREDVALIRPGPPFQRLQIHALHGRAAAPVHHANAGLGELEELAPCRAVPLLKPPGPPFPHPLLQLRRGGEERRLDTRELAFAGAPLPVRCAADAGVGHVVTVRMEDSVAQ